MYDISGAAPVHVRRCSDICRTTIGLPSDHPRTIPGPPPEEELVVRMYISLKKRTGKTFAGPKTAGLTVASPGEEWIGGRILS